MTTYSECYEKVGFAPGSLPASESITGERRNALRWFVKQYGAPAQLVHTGKFTSEDLRTIYNAADHSQTVYAVMARINAEPKSEPTPAPQPVDGGLDFSEPTPAPTPEPTPAPQPAPQPNGKADDLARILRDMVGNTLDEDRVRAIVREETKSTPRLISIKLTGKIEKKLDAAPRHYLFPTLLQYLGAGQHVLLIGPAGSGKTTMVEQAAEALGMSFELDGITDTRYVLSGFRDAQGNVAATAYRKQFANGGVYLADEMDSWTAQATNFLNAGLSNGYQGFPDGMVKRHKDFIFCGAANTYCLGGDHVYVGRNKLDGASLDRLTFLDVPYDENLERLCFGDTDWTKHVQKARKAAEELNIRSIISPRASQKGNELLAAGVSWPQVEASVLFKGMDKATTTKIRAAL